MRILVDHGAYLNLGDIAMLEGATLRLAKALPEAEIYVIYRAFDTVLWDSPRISKQPEYVVKPWFESILALVLGQRASSATVRVVLPFLGRGLSAGSIPFAVDSEILKAQEFCERFDALHLTGGGYLTDTFYSELFRKCCLMMAFAQQGKPILLTGQQIGPFRVSFSRKALFEALRTANFVGLRDPVGSLALCQEGHLDPKRVGLMGDDSFGLDPLADSIVSSFLASYDLKANEFLAFNVRIKKRTTPQIVRHLQQIGEFADKVASQVRMPILIVPIAIDPVEGDIVAGKQLAEFICSAQVLILDRDDLTPSLVKGVLGKAWGAVGVSYHFCTFALSQGVPAVSIYGGRYYTQKARGLCGFWGDDRLALPLRDINVDSAVEHVIQVFEDGLLREKIRLRARQAVERWQRVFDERVQDAFGGL